MSTTHLVFFFLEGASGSTVTPPVVVPQQGAGSAKKAKRRRLIVEIDGEEFSVSSEQEAQELLEAALVTAQEKADAELEKAAVSTLPRSKVIRVVRHKLQPPRISVPNISEADEFSIAVEQQVRVLQAKIAEVYEQAVKAAQLRKQQDDEDDFVIGMFL